MGGMFGIRKEYRLRSAVVCCAESHSRNFCCFQVYTGWSFVAFCKDARLGSSLSLWQVFVPCVVAACLPGSLPGRLLWCEDSR